MSNSSPLDFNFGINFGEIDPDKQLLFGNPVLSQAGDQNLHPFKPIGEGYAYPSASDPSSAFTTTTVTEVGSQLDSESTDIQFEYDLLNASGESDLVSLTTLNVVDNSLECYMQLEKSFLTEDGGAMPGLPEVPEFSTTTTSCTSDVTSDFNSSEGEGGEMAKVNWSNQQAALALMELAPACTSSALDLSASAANSRPSTPHKGKEKSSRKGKKQKMYELTNKDDPQVSRAIKAKEYREKLKQEAEKREKTLIQQLKAAEEEIASLKMEKERKEVVNPGSTTQMVINIVCAVKAAGGGDVIVSERLANRYAAELPEEEIQRIAKAASLAEPGKKFKLIIDLDREGKSLVAMKIDDDVDSGSS